MKAHKINLQVFQVEKMRLTNCPYCDKKINETEKYKDDYKPKEVILNIMLHPAQEHKGFRFYTVDKVAKKIGNCDKEEIVLDTKDYEIVKECFDKFKGYGKNDAELVRRVYEAEEVEVEEKKK